MKPTIQEVAEAAGVSIGTVSRVLRGHSSVADEKVVRVHEAVRSLNYRPLRQRRQPLNSWQASVLKDKNVALVLLGMDRSLTSLPYVAAAIHGVEVAVSKAGARLLLADVPHLDAVPPTLQNRVDGVLLKGAMQGRAIAETRNALLDRLRGLPSVWLLGRPEGCDWGDAATADDLEAGRLAAEHVLARGHRHLAFLNPKADHVTFVRREAGFLWGAQRAGVEVSRFIGSHPEHWELPLRPAQGVDDVQDLLDELLATSPRPTVVFTPADSIATIVYRAMAARNLQVGRDLSVISCNNELLINGSLYPSLTTIDVHSGLVGRRAVDQLAWRLVNDPNGPAMTLAVEPSVISGDSVSSL